MNKLFLLLRTESGATAIEYALIASFISIVSLIAITNIGTHISSTFSTVSSDIGTR